MAAVVELGRAARLLRCPAQPAPGLGRSHQLGVVEPRAPVCYEDRPRCQRPAVSQQLFTPFCSTKKDGQGIGLTLVRDVLLLHHCTFRLAPTAAGRTAFSIRFQP